jgi:hypothetical protein
MIVEHHQDNWKRIEIEKFLRSFTYEFSWSRTGECGMEFPVPDS